MGLLSNIFTWWDGATIGTSWYSLRKGKSVGEDVFGNKYYELRKPGEGESRRWVIYEGYADASKVAPEWHGWLHRTWEHPPTEVEVKRKAWEQPHLANMTGTADAYAPAGSLRQAKPKPRADYEAWSPE